MSVVTRWRKMFSSTTTQFNLMSGFSASNLGESFLSSIIAGLFTVAMVTVFCWAMALKPIKRTSRRGNAKRFFFVIWISGGLWTLPGATGNVGASAGSTCREVVRVNGAMEAKRICHRLLVCGLRDRTPRQCGKTNVPLRGILFGLGMFLRTWLTFTFVY